MHKRPLLLAIAGLLLGILANATMCSMIWMPVIGVTILLAVQVKRDRRKAFAAFRLFLFVLCLCLGWYRYEEEQDFRAAYESELVEGTRLTVQGELNEKEYKNEKYLYYLKNCYIVLSGDLVPCNQIIANTKQDVASIGEILIVEGDIDTFSQARNEGNFDELSFYQSQKIDLRMKEITVLERHGDKNKFREALFLLRQKLCRVYEQCMIRETSGVLAMMVLGEKSLIDSEIKALYQRVGISHILAISGLHISVIGMTLYKVLRKVGSSYWFAGIVAGLFMIAYGCMTGFRPSSARAICMFLMMLFAGMAGRTYDSLSALALAGFWLLYDNPFLLWYAGFLFSFAAVVGVVLVGNIVGKSIEEMDGQENSLKKKALKAFYHSFSIQLMTLPLTAYFYYEIPVYGIIVNLLILPLVGTLLAVGIIGGLVGLVSMSIASFLLLPCQWILLFYQQLSKLIQKLPYAALITGQPEIRRMILYYFILFGLVFFIAWKKKQRFFGLIGTFLLMYVLTLPKEGPEINVLDVGQGDGIHLRTTAGQNLFIDGGSSDIYQVGNYRILPFLKANGVRKIDYWFVSHADKDHISGLQELLEADYPVEVIVFSEQIVIEDTYKELLTLAEEKQTKVMWMGYLDRIHFGENTAFTCIFPYDDFRSEDKNAASLVLLYEEGDFAGLFTGDIGAEEEGWILNDLMNRETEYDEVSCSVIESGLDFYKAAHHGSKYSNSKSLLEYLQPTISVISSGINNRYGHPHKETLERLSAVGCEIWNTADYGQIIINMSDGKKVEIGEEVETGEEYEIIVQSWQETN